MAWSEVGGAGGGGGGDVEGPGGGSTDNAVARFDGTTGKKLKDSPNFLFDGDTLRLPFDTISQHFVIGDENDFSIDHDGTDTHLINHTGNLVIENTDPVDADIILKLGNNNDSTRVVIRDINNNELFFIDGAGKVGASTVTGIGAGGKLLLKGTDNSPTGGPVEVRGGGASNVGGAVQIIGGFGTNSGGRVDIFGGDGTNGTSGIVNIRGGSGDEQTPGGDIFLTGGNAGFDGGKGGDIIITTGTAEGLGEDSGEITLEAGTSQQGNVGPIIMARNAGNVLIGTVLQSAKLTVRENSASITTNIVSAIINEDITPSNWAELKFSTLNSVFSEVTGVLLGAQYLDHTNASIDADFVIKTTHNNTLLERFRISDGVVNIPTGNLTLGTGNIISPDGTSGVPISIKSGEGSAGNGGNLNLFSGDGFGSGGTVNLTAGDGPFAGGPININSGAASSSNSSGGLISLQSGSSSGTAPGGQLHVFAGIGGDNSGTGGQLLVHAGGGGNPQGTGGLLSLEGGQGFASGNTDGGDVELNSGAGFGTGNGGDITLDAKGGNISIDSSGGDVFLKESSGSVGIGTFAPSSKLTVKVDSSNVATNIVSTIINSDITNSNWAELKFSTFSSLFSEVTGVLLGAQYLDHTTASIDADFVIKTTHNNILSERFRISDAVVSIPTGFVGIGTSTPDELLHLLGTNPVLKIKGNGNFQQAELQLHGSRDANGAELALLRAFNFRTGTEVEVARISTQPSGGTDSGRLQFFTKSSGNALAEAMRIDVDGSVAMGSTTIASALLNVASVTKGFMQPRLTTTQRDAIASPATGLSIHNTDTRVPEWFDDTQWKRTSAIGITVLEIFTAENLDDIASGGVITISSPTVILMKADVTTSNIFDVQSGTRLSIISAEGGYELTYDGADTFITVINSRLNIKTVVVATGGGTLFDVSGQVTDVINIDFQGLIGWKMGTIRRSSGASAGPNVFLLHMAAINWQDTLTLENVSVLTVDEIALIPFAGAGVPFLDIKGDTPGSYSISLVSGSLAAGESLIRIDPGIADSSLITITDSTMGGTLFDISGGITGTFASVFDQTVALTTIDSVTDSSGIARFNFTVGPTLFVHQQVDMVNFTGVTSYNQTGIITAVGAGFFEIASIAFAGGDNTGDFSSKSVQMFETATALVDGDTLVIDGTEFAKYDGGATVYGKDPNTFRINRVFSFTVSGTWSTAGIDQTDPRVLANDNPGFASSEIVAFAEMNANAVSTTVSDGVYAPIDVSTLIDNVISERFKLIDAVLGIYEFTGNEDCSCFVTAFVWVTKTGSIENYRFAVSLNGAIPVFATAPYTPMEVKTTKVPTVVIEPLQLTKGDTVQIMVAGDGTGDDPTITDCKLKIE